MKYGTFKFRVTRDRYYVVDDPGNPGYSMDIGHKVTHGRWAALPIHPDSKGQILDTLRAEVDGLEEIGALRTEDVILLTDGWNAYRTGDGLYHVHQDGAVEGYLRGSKRIDKVLHTNVVPCVAFSLDIDVIDDRHELYALDIVISAL